MGVERAQQQPARIAGVEGGVDEGAKASFEFGRRASVQ